MEASIYTQEATAKAKAKAKAKEALLEDFLDSVIEMGSV